MWPTIIAVLGALAGAALGGGIQHLTASRDRVEEHRRQHRQDVVTAVRELLAAAIAYREHFWLRIAALRDAEFETSSERAALYRARSELTNARDALVLLTNDPGLTHAARDVSWSAIELSEIKLGPVDGGRFAGDVEARLEAGRALSRDAHTTLRDAGVAYVHGTPPPPGADSRQHFLSRHPGN
ncbi:hypothetical protein ABZX40_36435 [Streptomyces sp. NPDC004610]|uniref:hypothetical protein n=1 Tax=unclassified Streptomyces TaxID=2593676 RepID=UPI0033A39E22